MYGNLKKLRKDIDINMCTIKLKEYEAAIVFTPVSDTTMTNEIYIGKKYSDDEIVPFEVTWAWFLNYYIQNNLDALLKEYQKTINKAMKKEQ